MNADDRVWKAANTILLRGKKPSWELVRDVLGGGSKTTIVPALSRFWTQMGWRSALQMPVQRVEVSVPASNDMVPRAEMERALQLERDRAEGERRHLMAMTDRIREDITAPAQNKIAELQRANQKLADQLFLANAKVAALERERR